MESTKVNKQAEPERFSGRTEKKMYSLADAEYFYSKKTRKAISRKAYEMLLEQKTKGVKSIDGIEAVQRKMRFDFCYKDKQGVFTKPNGTVLEGLEETL